MSNQPATATTYTKPLPEVIRETKPFWDAAKQHEIRLPHCKACGQKWLPPTAFCPNCLSEEIDWVRASGRAKVVTWATFVEVEDRRWPEIPYTCAQVELEEGPRLTTQLVGVTDEDVRMNMPVEVVFDDVTPEISLLKFRPVRS